MNPGLIVPLALVAVIVAVLAFRLLQNRKARLTATASTCGDVAHPGGTLDPSAWYIGPDLSHIGPPPDWGNKSPGMPTHPAPAAGGGFEFDVPVGVDLPLGTGNKVDSLAFKHGPLTGKTQIHLTLNVEGDGQLIAVPEVDPNNRMPARVTIYFQREGDDWSTADEYEAYRWYYTAQEFYLKPGVNDLIVPLDKGWTATSCSTIDPASVLPSVYNPTGFKGAVDHCCCAGFGFGGNEVGRIHGMRATAPAKITVTRFDVT